MLLTCKFDRTIHADHTFMHMATADQDNRNDIYEGRLKAGKRTYFFDVRETRGGEYYLTLTEVTKKTDRSGNPSHIRNKLFLYKEDMDAFVDGLQDAIHFIREAKGQEYGTEGRAYDHESNAGKSDTTDHQPENNAPKDYNADFTFDDL